MLRKDPPVSRASAVGEISWPYSPMEMRVDAAIHGLGIVLVVLGAAALVVAMPRSGRPETTAAVVYMATLAFSILASAAYNVWPISRMKWVLRRFDHSAIYLLIAGTYTPFTIKAGMGWLLGLVWLVAAFGVSLKICRPGQFDRLSIALYLALGWCGIAVIDRLAVALPAPTLWLIGAGGLVYSLGVIFHVWERLRFQNAIWHGFVLAGASIHYAAVWSVL